MIDPTNAICNSLTGSSGSGSNKVTNEASATIRTATTPVATLRPRRVWPLTYGSATTTAISGSRTSIDSRSGITSAPAIVNQNAGADEEYGWEYPAAPNLPVGHKHQEHKANDDHNQQGRDWRRKDHRQSSQSYH